MKELLIWAATAATLSATTCWAEATDPDLTALINVLSQDCAEMEGTISGPHSRERTALFSLAAGYGSASFADEADFSKAMRVTLESWIVTCRANQVIGGPQTLLGLLRKHD